MSIDIRFLACDARDKVQTDTYVHAVALYYEMQHILI